MLLIEAKEKYDNINSSLLKTKQRKKSSNTKQTSDNLRIRQLRRRLGELPESQCSQIKSFPVSQLEDLGEALLDFQGIDDLDDWLQKYTKLS